MPTSRPALTLQVLQQQQSALPLAQRQVIDVILQDPGAAVLATVEQLAAQAHVSMPTIVRMCRRFGYDSVREFMVALAQTLAVSGSHLHRSVREDDSTGDVVSKIVHAAAGAIANLGQKLDAALIDEVAAKIVRSVALLREYRAALITEAVAGLSSRTNRLGSAAAIWTRAPRTASIATIVRARSASRAPRSVSPLPRCGWSSSRAAPRRWRRHWWARCRSTSAAS